MRCNRIRFLLLRLGFQDGSGDYRLRYLAFLAFDFLNQLLLHGLGLRNNRSLALIGNHFDWARAVSGDGPVDESGVYLVKFLHHPVHLLVHLDHVQLFNELLVELRCRWEYLLLERGQALFYHARHSSSDLLFVRALGVFVERLCRFG